MTAAEKYQNLTFSLTKCNREKNMKERKKREEECTEKCARTERDDKDMHRLAMGVPVCT